MCEDYRDDYKLQRLRLKRELTKIYIPGSILLSIIVIFNNVQQSQSVWCKSPDHYAFSFFFFVFFFFFFIRYPVRFKRLL